MTRNFSTFCFGLLALFAASSAFADVDVWVGSGAGCNVATIQAAINSASNVNGVTNIRIAKNQTYTGQQLNITSKNVRLIGGYPSCAQPTDGTRTLISGAGGAANTVITVIGSTSTVVLRNLEIVGGDEVTTSVGKGGGIAVGGGPHALVSIENTWIHDNQAGYGGGLWVENENSSNANDVFVKIADNSLISANYGAYGGGGVWCRNAKVNMTGAVNAATGSAIYLNTTAGIVNGVPVNGPGGGIRAENCVMNIATRSTSAALGTITLNIAGGNGGGISVSGERAEINLYTQEASRATSILLNEAGGVGGGIDVGSSAKVNAYDVIIDSNTARLSGGGVSVFDNDPFPDATMRMTHSLSGAPAVAGSAEGVAVNCTAIQRCNRISQNVAATVGGARRPGAAARIDTDNGVLRHRSRGYLRLSGTEISGNDGESLLRLYAGGDYSDPYALMDGALIVDNAVSAELLHNPDTQGAGNSGYLSIVNTTIAGNMIGAAEVIRTTTGYALINSIVWQPGKRMLNVLNGTPDATQTDYVLTSDLLGVPPSTHNLVADPQFVNAPGGNYRLRPSSPAIDYAPILSSLVGPSLQTVDNLPRLVDLQSVPNEFGAQDLGAYERQFACAEDTIFCNGFE